MISGSRPVSERLTAIAPLGFVILALFIKSVYASLSLASLWWAPEESSVDWFRSHPQIVTAALASPMILMSAVAALSHIRRYACAVALDALITTLIVADLVHAQYYGDVPSVRNWTSGSMFWAAVPSIVALLRPGHLVYYLDVAVLLLAFPFYVRASRRDASQRSRLSRRVSLALCIFGFVLMIPTARSVVTSDANAVFAASSLQRDVYAEMGVLPYHALDVIAHLAPDRANTPAAGRARVITHLVRRRAERAQRSPLFGAARDRNLILVLAESLQGFPVDLTIRGQRITPNLAELARESMYFVNFYEQTHLGTTADGEFITMQSLHAAPVGVVATVYNTNRFRALPHVLSREGYSTFSAVGEPGDFWDMDRMHPALGFGRSFFANDYSATERIGDWIADREFLEESIPRLANQREPFMAYLLTSSNHRPWNLPAKYRMLDLGKTEPDELENYLQSVHYFDWALGRFVDQLRHDGFLDRSVLVVLGDHQAFLERSDLAALLGSAQHRDDYLVARKRVPLLIRLPDGAAAGIRTEVGGQIDIAPTLLTLLGVEDLESVMLGSDLTFGGDSLVVFRDGSFINGRHYAVNRFGPIENSTCYERLSGRRVSCTTMTDQRQLAREQLEISDAILRFNLVPSVALHPSIRER